MRVGADGGESYFDHVQKFSGDCGGKASEGRFIPRVSLSEATAEAAEMRRQA